MAITPPVSIQPAPRLPLPYGLFSTFTMRSGDRWESGVQWEAGTCAPADGIGAAECDPTDPETPVIGLPKNLDPNRADYGEATPFVVYGHFACSPVGYTPDSAQTEATKHLLAREEARVEQAFWTGDLGNAPFLQGPDTVVLGTGLDPALALGLLEEYIASEYGSLGVIHVNRATASLLTANGKLIVTGGRLMTVLGTPVAAGAGYSRLDLPNVGPIAAAFATPALFGYRSEVFTSSNRSGDLLDRSTNDLYAVAERAYLLGFDPCGVGMVQIALTDDPPLNL